MMEMFNKILPYIIPVLFSITLHEAGHAYAARYFGDPTAAMMGRLSLNPIKHIDPLGTIVIPLLLYFATDGAFVFGYAKPVPVMERNLRNPRKDAIWVALAGPMANFIQAFLWAIFLVLLYQFDLHSEPFFLQMANAGIIVNLVMWAFNLFPIPPLDGGRILVGLLPWQYAEKLRSVEPYGFFIVMALVYTKIVSTIWLIPLITLARYLIDLIVFSPARFLFS